MDFLGSVVDESEYPFIVAEISCNHLGSLDKALRLIEHAKEAGANAVKIQTFTPEEMTYESSNADFHIHSGEWSGENLFDLYSNTAIDFEWIPRLFAHADIVGIPLFSSVFGPHSLGVLESNKCPGYKIASFEANDLNLINMVQKTGKPLVISTGTLNHQEINRLLGIINNNYRTALLHCVSSYPCKLSDINLDKLGYLINRYAGPVGFSDHTQGYIGGAIAVTHGAVMLEKHLGLNENDGPDASFSLNPAQFAQYVKIMRDAFDATMTEPEESTQFKRSIYVVRDIRRGEKLTKDHIKIIRPSYGMEPYLYDKVLGQKVNEDIKAGTALHMKHLLFGV